MKNALHYFKRKIHLEETPKPSNSWLWMKSLHVRDKYAHCIGRVIRSGATSPFWNDPWHPWKVLRINHPELKRKLPILEDVRVALMIQENEWRISDGRGWDNQAIESTKFAKVFRKARGMITGFENQIVFLSEKCI